MDTLKTLLVAFLICFSSVCMAGPIDINHADAKSLTTLKGIGPAKAAAIVDYRNANGPFDSVDQVVQVKGIGEHTMNMNKEMMGVGDDDQR